MSVYSTRPITLTNLSTYPLFSARVAQGLYAPARHPYVYCEKPC
jgi:hypothetical protein